MATKQLVDVSPLFIDRISFTLDAKRNRELLFDRTKERLCSSSLSNLVSRPKLDRSRYRQSYQLALNVDAMCLLQCAPLKETDSGFRVELNPEKAGKQGLSTLKEILLGIFGDQLAATLHAGHVTKIDLTVDFKGVKLDELIIHRDGVRKSSMYFGTNGELETVYLGTRHSDNQIKFYDKAKEIALRTGVVANKNWVRLELSVCPKRRQLSALSSIPNPFDGVFIVAVDHEVIAMGSDTFRLFVEACRSRTTVSALQLIRDPDRRRKLEAKLFDNWSVDWWNPDTVWKGFAAALDKLQLIPGATYT